MTTNDLKPARTIIHDAIAALMNDHCAKYVPLIAAAALLFAPAYWAHAQVAMAPPLDASASNTVFNWTDIPVNQNVPIVRAVFDQGGYQLFDTAGETIVVPFTNNNLYVMKFAETSDSQMSFCNCGSAPVLYLPAGAGIENAAYPGTYWYPFTGDSFAHTPVYLGIAPNWNAFISMGWYPNMVVNGGYWWHNGDQVAPLFGFSVVFGGEEYNGWDSYDSYYRANPAPHHTGYWHRNVYSRAVSPVAGRAAFSGSSAGFTAGSATGGRGGRAFGGAQTTVSRKQFRGTQQQPSGGAAAPRASRTYRGTTSPGTANSFKGSQQPSGTRPVVGGSSHPTTNSFSGGSQRPAQRPSGVGTARPSTGGGASHAPNKASGSRDDGSGANDHNNH
jgi:hypothetical protein